MTEDNSKQQIFYSGFISIVGRPNVGKSTLLNRLIGKPISITANRPQTTRNQVRGILNGDNYQAVLVDTPGIHIPHNELHRRIVDYATQSIPGADLVFFLIEPLRSQTDKLSEEDELVLKAIKESNSKVILVINKIDQSSESLILRTIKNVNERFVFLETIAISALKGKGVDFLPNLFQKYLPEGPRYYPEDQITDVPERVIAGEFIREQIFRQCFHEVPYGVAVIIESFQEDAKILKIYANIFVERETQKGIIIGSKGAMLRKIGQFSREKIEKLLGTKVFLSLNIKVSKNWFNNKRKLNDLGYSQLK